MEQEHHSHTYLQLMYEQNADFDDVQRLLGTPVTDDYTVPGGVARPQGRPDLPGDPGKTVQGPAPVGMADPG